MPASLQAAGRAFNAAAARAPAIGQDTGRVVRCVLLDRFPDKPVVLVGLMGAGKTRVGRLLAIRLNREFIDADSEIEASAGCSIEDIFARFGEEAFRDGERRVIERLMETRNSVIATGGGAFASARTRADVRARGVSVWLRADLDVLVERVSQRNDRPLLKEGDKRATLARLMTERHPYYAEADITVESGTDGPDAVVESIVGALCAHCETASPEASGR